MKLVVKPKDAFIMVASIALGSGSLLAMTAVPGAPRPCRLHAAEKLPESAGGAGAVCDTVERAIADAAPGLRYRVDVHVVGPSSIKATLSTADGRSFPEQRLVVNDRLLSRESIDRFARAIAAQLAGTRN